MVVQSYIQIFSASWVTTILYNYGATLCDLHWNIHKQLILIWAGYYSWGRQWQTQIITKVRVFTKDRVSTSRQPSISILPFYALPCLAPPAPPIYQPVPHLLQEWIQDWIHKNISYCLQPKSSACLILFLLSFYCSSPHPPTQKKQLIFLSLTLQPECKIFWEWGRGRGYAFINNFWAPVV